MSNDKILLRIVKLRSIKNNSIRRSLMIILFIPALIISYAVVSCCAIWVLFSSFFRFPVSLFKSAVDYWENPAED